MRSSCLMLGLPLAALGCGPPVACRVIENVTGAAIPTGEEREHHFASDGRLLRVMTRGHYRRGLERYEYDARGNVTEIRSESKQDSVPAPVHHLPQQHAFQTEATTLYFYDGKGHRLRAVHRERRRSEFTNERGQTRFDWSPIYETIVTYRYRDGWLARISRWKDGELAETWELHHEQTCLTAVQYLARADRKPSMQWQFDCDRRGRRLSERHSADFLARPWTYKYDYDEAGRLQARWLLEGDKQVLAERFEYNRHGHIIAVDNGPGGGTLVSTQFRYDGDARVLELRQKDITRRYLYEARCSAAMTQSLQPEPLGPITRPYARGDAWAAL